MFGIKRVNRQLTQVPGLPAIGLCSPDNSRHLRFGLLLRKRNQRSGVFIFVNEHFNSDLEIGYLENDWLVRNDSKNRSDDTSGVGVLSRLQDMALRNARWTAWAKLQTYTCSSLQLVFSVGMRRTIWWVPYWLHAGPMVYENIGSIIWATYWQGRHFTWCFLGLSSPQIIIEFVSTSVFTPC